MDIIKNKAEYDQVLADNKSVFVDFYQFLKKFLRIMQISSL